MAKMTIAQMREREVARLAEICGDRDKAYNLMYRFYRLCGMDSRLLELQNDERTYNSHYTLDLEERREKAFQRLRNDFRSFGLDLKYGGVCPTICEYTPNDSRIGREIIGRFFYQ